MQLRNRLQELATQRSGAYPLNYDYSVSTQANYSAAPGQSDSHVGPYAKIRASLRLDISRNLYARSSTAAGPAHCSDVGNRLGAEEALAHFHGGSDGRGQVARVQWMYERGTFLVDKLVHCDPDLLRSALPEWAGYVARDPLTAGA